MRLTLVSIATLLCEGLAAIVPPSSQTNSNTRGVTKQAHDDRSTSCRHSPTSRSCWGKYSIDTDYYSVVPNTGVTREYWLSVENSTIAPDGYSKPGFTFNGTFPGPTLTADWGDNLVIHVTNNLQHNGTAVHWHGIRQLGSLEYDGVPGVTQCPIAPGESFTYKFRATQYGTTWYHSHFTLQYSDGLQGALIINGPATANYDEDLGPVFLSDLAHKSHFELWWTIKKGGFLPLPNSMINGMNTFDCSESKDPACIGGGKKFEAVLKPGKKHRMRLINTATEAYFQFSIDGHSMTVIANDLVPIVPYKTDSILINVGQRYDIIIEANAKPGDYWMRGGWLTACSENEHPDNFSGIIRYNRKSTANPTTKSKITLSETCSDEDSSKLVPHLAMNVVDIGEVTEEDVNFSIRSYAVWTINSTSLYLDWAQPTVLRIENNETIFPTDYNVHPIERKGTSTDEFAVYVVEDASGFGVAHPMHLHGHDFWIVAQGKGRFDLNTTKFNLKNPPRRDTANLPGNGYLAIAFKKDNPGSWLLHCHFAWHTSEGLAMQFVESQSEITIGAKSMGNFQDTCSSWKEYAAKEVYLQDDSGV